jgi:hypothetical protein
MTRGILTCPKSDPRIVLDTPAISHTPRRWKSRLNDPVEGFHRVIRTCLDLGFGPGEVRTMISVNPKRLLWELFKNGNWKNPN